MGIETLKKELTTLDPKELQQIALAVSHLIEIKGQSSRKKSKSDEDKYPNREFFFIEVSSAVRRVASDPIPPYQQVLTNKTLGPLLNAAYIFVEDYLQRIKGSVVIDRPRRLWYYQLFARLLITRLKAAEAPVTLRLVLQSAEKFPTALDRAFPGYVESGLLFMIFKPQPVKEAV